MSPEDRDAISTSIANLWTFNSAFIAELLGSLEGAGALEPEYTEGMLQRLDASLDQILHGSDDQLYAASLLATVRTALRHRRGG